MIPTVTMFPKPRVGYYEYGDPVQRSTYKVLGVALTQPDESDAYWMCKATWLFVERPDGHLTWLSMGRLTLEPDD